MALFRTSVAVFTVSVETKYLLEQPCVYVCPGGLDMSVLIKFDTEHAIILY
jgi:hypothetical protein